jgi:hypothetical protein
MGAPLAIGIMPCIAALLAQPIPSRGRADPAAHPAGADG